MLMADLVAQLAPVTAECYESPHKAWTAFMAAPEKFQFVITDLEMPGMDGIQLCRRLHAVAPELKVMLLTGNQVWTEAEARLNGFCGLLRKPFPLATLQKTLALSGVLESTSENFPGVLMPA